MISVLFARSDSVYKLMGLDVWDIDRDAMKFKGRGVVIAHPPCRGWGRLRRFAKPRPGELNCARFAVDVIRKNGGVLEHPQCSALWKDKGLPAPGSIDKYGGFTIVVNQHDFGHKARKTTWLYICGCNPGQMPKPGLKLGEPSHVVAKPKSPPKYRPVKPEISKAERESTPVGFALFLIGIAALCCTRVKA